MGVLIVKLISEECICFLSCLISSSIRSRCGGWEVDSHLFAEKSFGIRRVEMLDLTIGNSKMLPLVICSFKSFNPIIKSLGNVWPDHHILWMYREL